MFLVCDPAGQRKDRLDSGGKRRGDDAERVGLAFDMCALPPSALNLLLRVL